MTTSKDLRDALYFCAAELKSLDPASLRAEHANRLIDLFDAQSQVLNDLTLREMDMLRGLVSGYDNKGIACHFHISAETVKEHMANMFRKLNVDSRMKAAVLAVRCGLEPL